ncbi:hypothetical protein HC256_004566 [Beauveria bassiana]|nr:hypothetical protein HC256_004566 [Beauveria bassiana]
MPPPPLPQGSSNSAEHAKLVVHLRHQWLINLLDQSSLTSLAATPAPSHQLQETPDSQVQAAICLPPTEPPHSPSRWQSQPEAHEAHTSPEPALVGITVSKASVAPTYCLARGPAGTRR